MSYAFISHSSEDKALAEQLAQSLEKERVWFDVWDLNTGDLIPRKLAESIHDSKWFILLASQKAMESRWVRYELNIAIMNWIQDNEYRIIVSRIDDCQVHPELSPFLYVDCPGQPNRAIDEIVKLILAEGGGIVKPAWSKKSQIVNRFKEIAAIEDVTNEGMNFILLWGLYGIGKTVLGERAASQVFNSHVSRFPLTRTHDLLRLSLELSARAKRQLPPPFASDEELLTQSVDSINQLIDNGYIVFFDDIEQILDEEGKFPDFVTLLLEKCHHSREYNIPILLASTRYPNLLPSLKDKIHVIKVDRLEDKHIRYCLEKWLRLTEPSKKVIESKKLTRVIPFLYGYPLAARYASSMIAKYSVDILLEDVSHFKRLQLDLAIQLLGRMRKTLSDLEAKCLEALTIADTGLSLSELSNTLEVDVNILRETVDMLVGSLIIFPEDGRLQIHTLLKEYFWDQAYKSGSYLQLAEKLGELARLSLPTVPEQSEDYVRLCARAFQLLMLAGKEREAQDLAYYFKGGLKDVSRRLYFAKKFELSLKYMNTYLEMNPNDLFIRLLRARCFIRLKRYDEAKDALDEVEGVGYKGYRVDQARGFLRREQGDIGQAVLFFKRGLDDRPDYIPLLRDLGDGLDRLGDIKGAIKVLRQAYKLAPRDRYVVPKYVDVLVKSDKRGNIKEALEIIEEAITAYPEEAIFEHRISTILLKLGNERDSYYHAKRAVELDGTLYEAKLHLAALERRCGNYKGAEKLLKELPSRLPKRFLISRDTIHAEIKIDKNDFNAARKLLKRYDLFSNPYLANVAARIELFDTHEAFGKDELGIAKDRLKRCREITERALIDFPEDRFLQQTMESIIKWEKQL
jgi:tetratricopeptide (TPR) repeat protein